MEKKPRWWWRGFLDKGLQYVLEYAPGLDAKDLTHGLDGVHEEVDGTCFVGGDGG